MSSARFLLLMIIPYLLASCAPMSRYQAVDSPLLQQASKNARTLSDHLVLTEHYESLAREMQANAGEQQKLLDHYQEKSYFYGRQAQDRQSHTWALMIKYEQAAKASLSKADFHRRVAAELRHRNAPAERLTHAKARGPATIGDDARNGLAAEDR
jgi:hypothetical protein